jgi:hypothetical protein
VKQYPEKLMLVIDDLLIVELDDRFEMTLAPDPNISCINIGCNIDRCTQNIIC